ncbi:unnamed protein product [Dovyalis caffra]|uniref:Uncharacterized protein n=1 Tax=Dovyalis caffra TaxID=77055 RepID=A0AAV1SSU8_9ROSI|nr:unnamed protein product [Dovyalis caffra]
MAEMTLTRFFFKRGSCYCWSQSTIESCVFHRSRVHKQNIHEFSRDSGWKMMYMVASAQKENFNIFGMDSTPSSDVISVGNIRVWSDGKSSGLAMKGKSWRDLKG